VFAIGAVALGEWLSVFWAILRLTEAGLIGNAIATAGANIVLHIFQSYHLKMKMKQKPRRGAFVD
jgi:hypothetical protein